jgi:hypothetical protein
MSDAQDVHLSDWRCLSTRGANIEVPNPCSRLGSLGHYLVKLGTYNLFSESSLGLHSLVTISRDGRISDQCNPIQLAVHAKSIQASRADDCSVGPPHSSDGLSHYGSKWWYYRYKIRLVSLMSQNDTVSFPSVFDTGIAWWKAYDSDIVTLACLTLWSKLNPLNWAQ